MGEEGYVFMVMFYQQNDNMFQHETWLVFFVNDTFFVWILANKNVDIQIVDAGPITLVDE